MKLTYRFVFSLLLFFSITAVFSQNLSDQEIGFDAARITVALKKRGMTDQNIQEEIVLMRKVQNEQYAVMKKRENEQYTAMKKKEDEILQKITSEQALKTETNKTANIGLTSKTALITADIPQTEKDALLALYNSTNGNNWTNKTGWNFSTPVTSGWYGITVTGGHVTAINLYNNKLSGTIPVVIGQLTQLKNLQLYNNQLSGTIPVEIGQLTQLQILSLSGNQLSGTIPASIGQLTQLQTLYLNVNQLSGTIPVEIGQLTQLQILSLSGNQLSGTIPAAIGQLAQLQSLQLNINQLSGTIPAEVGLLTKLTSLYLNQNQLSGTIPAEIGQLTQLTLLSLHTNQLTGTIPAEIGLLTKLTSLYLGPNKLSGTIPASIGQLTQLNTLYLNDNQLSGAIPAVIGLLTKLQILYLHTNQLSGKIPSSIGQLTQLLNLSLNNNQLTGAIPVEINQLIKIQHINLSVNQLSGTIPASIVQLTQLQNLHLYNNQLSGTIPVAIGQLIQLQNLWLNNNQLTGTIPASIGRLTNIIRLYLHSNQLSGTIPAEIGQLTQALELSLYNNKLNGAIPIQIGQLTKLQNVYLHTNQLSGKIPVEIGQLTQLQNLHLYTNQLSGTIPVEIGQLTKLTSLYLQVNQLSGTIPAAIGQLTQLTTLYLNQNQLSGTIPPIIGQLTKLTSLYLHTNQLSGIIPAELGQLPLLQTLHLYSNQFEGKIPDLTNVITTLNFQYNKFRFVDFSSQFDAYKSKLTLFGYSNQSKTDSEITIAKAVGETQTLTMYEDNRFTPADTYQWYKNGQAIAGATSRQYTLANLTLANAGDYYCISKNPQMTITTVTIQNLALTRNTIHLSISNCNSVLSSAVGTDTQTICNSAAITPITYTTAGLITGATFSGLPAGVTGNFTSNTVTISGTPSYAGTFPYTVTYTGNCGSTVTSKGTITVSVETVNAASAAPAICTNTALAPITHRTFGGTLTPGTPAGLPAGVTVAWASNILTISGTPTASGVYNYNIPLLSGCGNTINATGTITVSDPGTITLSSATGTDNQSKNVNTIITPITYTTSGTTGATITGLPAGVTGSFASNTVTISGTPTVSGAFNYSIVLIGTCNTTITGRITTLCEPITGIIKIIQPVTYSSTKSGSFSRNNCAVGKIGSVVNFSASATSNISQADADLKAQTAVNAGGQAYANTNGTCTTATSTYYYQGQWTSDDTIHKPEINCWVKYLDENGVEDTFFVGGSDNGCQQLVAASIVQTNHVIICTP